MKKALFFVHISSGNGLHDRFEIQDYSEETDLPVLFSAWIAAICRQVESKVGKGVVVVNCNMFK